MRTVVALVRAARTIDGMGLLDDAKKLGDKAKELVAEHDEQIVGAIDKAVDFVDDKTGGKHADKLKSAADKAKDAVAKIADKPGGDAPPATPPAS